MAKKKTFGSVITGILLFIAIVILLIFVAFNILFYKSPIIGISMQPTYNAELPEGESASFYENSNIKDKAYVYRFGKGSVGDIILAQRTTIVDGTESSKLIIKRIVATGGQTVDIKQDSGNYYLYVDGEKQEENYIKDISGMEVCYNTFVAYKSSVGIAEDTPITLEQDEVFILGDNRGHSLDSSSFGPIKTNIIKGKVAFVVRYNENLFSYLWNKIF